MPRLRNLYDAPTPGKSQKEIKPSADPKPKDIDPAEVAEARRLLTEIDSWTKEDIEELPPLAKKKAQKYQQLDL